MTTRLAQRSSSTATRRISKPSTLLAVAYLVATIVLPSCGTAPAPPSRLVSLSPSATETLYAIGAGSAVVGADPESNFPNNVPVKKDLSGFHPDINALTSYRPDLVILEQDAQDPNGKSIIGELKDKKIRYMLQPTPRSLDAAYQDILDLGSATGHLDRANSLVSEMKKSIMSSVQSAPRKAWKYYHEVDTTYYTVSSQSFIGSIYQQFGLRSIGDAVDKAGTGYPSVSGTDVVSANPDIVFLADAKCCGQRLSTVASRPGWATIPAVANGRVEELNDDIASRWGPRMTEFAQQISGTLNRYK